MPMAEREVSSKSDVRTAKRWFAYCLIVAVACTIAAAIAWLAIFYVAQNYGAALFLLVLAFFLAIIGATFSFLALTRLVDWLLMRRQR
jgi:hypothetical protein